LIEQARSELPELPDAKKLRFKEQYGVDEETAVLLTHSKDTADYYEAVISASGCEVKLCTNWMTGHLAGALNKDGLDITQSPIGHARFAGLLARIADNTISGKIAKQVFEALWHSDQTADEIIDQKGLKQITDTGAIEAIIDEVIANNAGQVEQYLSGKDKVFGFFVGQVMKLTQGKANPGEVNAMLKEKLKR